MWDDSMLVLFGILMAVGLVISLRSNAKTRKQLWATVNIDDDFENRSNALFALYEIMWWYWMGADRPIKALRKLVQAEADKITDYYSSPSAFVALRDFMNKIDQDKRFAQHKIKVQPPEDWLAARGKFELSATLAHSQVCAALANKSTHLNAKQLYELWDLRVIQLPPVALAKLTLHVAATNV